MVHNSPYPRIYWEYVTTTLTINRGETFYQTVKDAWEYWVDKVRVHYTGCFNVSIHSFHKYGRN